MIPSRYKGYTKGWKDSSKAEQEQCKVSEYDKDHIWYKGNQYISLRRFLEVKAEQVPKTGHWINHILSIECSCCGNKLFADDENENCEDYDAIDDLGYKFCPNCGAEMKGGAE